MGWSRFTSADWRAVVALTGRERLVLASAAVLLPLTTASLELVGYRRVRRRFERLFRRGRPPRHEKHLATLTQRMVMVSATHSPAPSTCLARSLVLWALLRAQGVESELRFGVRRVAGDLDIHAWVEHRGCPLNDSPDVSERFRILPIPSV